MAGVAGRSGGNRWLSKDASPPDGGPVRPSGMPKEWNSKWDELLGQLSPLAEDLRRIDCHQLKVLTTLLVHEDYLARQLVSDPTDQKSRRLYQTTVQGIGRLSLLFGLSPRDRKTLNLKPPSEDDNPDEWSDEG